MKLKVIIEYDKKGNSFSAICPQLPGCVSCGDSQEEALENIKEAIELYFQSDDNDFPHHAATYEVSI